MCMSNKREHIYYGKKYIFLLGVEQWNYVFLHHNYIAITELNVIVIYNIL